MRVSELQYTFTPEVPFSKIPNPQNAQIEPCDDLVMHLPHDAASDKAAKKERERKKTQTFTQKSFIQKKSNIITET